jgi:uncharacterized protein YvpB
MNKRLLITFFIALGLLSSPLFFVSAQETTTADDLGASTPKASNPLDNPKLSVRIPGLNFDKAVCTEKECSNSWIANYIVAIYKYGISTIGILAVITIMIGGIVWLTAGGNQGRIADAKKWIGGSLMGVLIAFTSYVILNMVNPALTELSPIKLAYIENIALLEILEPEALTDQYTNDSLPKINLGTGEGHYKVPVLYQGRYKSYNKGYAKCGCGPAALTMVLNFYGINKSIPEIAETAAANGNWTGGTDSSCGGWTGGMAGFQKILNKYNLKSKTGGSFEDIKSLLSFGPVIASIKNTGGCSFTCNKHYVVFTDYKNGFFYTNDPNEYNLNGNKCGGIPTNIISESNAKKGCEINAGVIAVYK